MLRGLLWGVAPAGAGSFLASRLLGPTIAAAILAEVTVPLAALCLAGGRLLLDARRRQGRYYGLTDVRAIIVQQEEPQSVQSVLLVEPIKIQLVEESRGRGSIEFSPPLKRTLWNYGAHSQAPTFVQIDDAREVFERFFGAGRRNRPL